MEKYTNENNRVIYYDMLNICACFCVVCMHCNGIVHFYADTSAWKQSLIVESFAYWAVPVFFMLTGANLMKYRKRYSTKIFLKKRMQKVLIPFLVWSIIFGIGRYMQGTWTYYGIRSMIDAFINTKIEPMYWFFIPLFAVYLSMPVLSWLTEEKCRKTLWYMVIVGITLCSVVPFGFQLMQIGWNWDLNLPVMGGYILFVILGYLLSTMEIPSVWRKLLYLGAILGGSMKYIGTYVLSESAGEIVRTCFSYLYLPAVLLAVGVFVLFKHIHWEKMIRTERANKFVRTISGCSFGIYLIHNFILVHIRDGLNIDPSGFLWRFLGPFAIYFIGLLVCYLLKQIPGIRRILP